MTVLRSPAILKCARTLLAPRAGRRAYATQIDSQPLVKPASLSRSEWERSRCDSGEEFKRAPASQSAKRLGPPKNHTGFGRPHTHKSKIGTAFIAKLQGLTSSSPSSELRNLLMKISQHIDELNAYELIDVGYYLTRVNSEGCVQVVEPILHRFFSLPERHSCLNGVYIHRLLRTMFIYQDVTYRVWVYEIAQIVGTKHRHMLMRDVQLVIDDLSLFYDAAAQGVLANFEDVIISRAHELDIGRLPLVIHALGRSGYNSIDVARTIHDVYMSKRSHSDFYLCHHIGLLLKGYVAFHFHPGREFLDIAWAQLRESIKTAEFKYISWLGESFLRLRYVQHAPAVLDELLNKHHVLSHLEFTDFISGCCAIQFHLLSGEFRRYVVAGSEWQAAGDPDVLVDSPESMCALYRCYKRLLKVVVSGMSGKIYCSTPPYRATQFELLTRLLAVYPNPREFRDVLPLRKFDAAYPVVKFPGADEPRRCSIDYVFTDNGFLRASKLFGDGHTLEGVLDESLETDSPEMFSHMELDHQTAPLSAKLDGCDKELPLAPLPDLLKQYLHAIFFRTPALAPRGIRILLQALMRIHFEQREDCVMEPDLLPPMKTAYYSRPLSRAIIREVYRKLACYNTDDLLVSLFCMFPLRIFELEMAPTLLSQLTGMWFHQVGEDILTADQKRIISLFYETLRENSGELYAGLDSHAVETIMQAA